MRVAIYARVSTSDQDELLQLPRLRDYAGRAGWEIFREYTDSATGKNCDRPGWRALMSDARGRFFDRILIVKLDRMMRSVRILLDELEDLDRHEIQVYALDIGLLDLRSPSSRLLLTVLGSIAEWEGEMISVRTKEALAARKARGQALGRPAADLPIHMIVLRRLRGDTWKKIADDLNLNVSTVKNHKKEIEDAIAEMEVEEKIRRDAAKDVSCHQ